MFALKNFNVHLMITYEAVKWIFKSCWFILFNKKMTYPCKGVARQKSK